MPQGERLPDTWKAELGPDWAQTWQSLRHTLGNLTWTLVRSRPAAETRVESCIG